MSIVCSVASPLRLNQLIQLVRHPLGVVAIYHRPLSFCVAIDWKLFGIEDWKPSSEVEGKLHVPEDVDVQGCFVFVEETASAGTTIVFPLLPEDEDWSLDRHRCGGGAHVVVA